MPVYKYKAYGSSKVEEQGIITADTPQQARDLLRMQGLFPSSLEESQSRNKSKGRSFFRGRIDRQVMVAFRLLSSLLRTGVPLAKALELVVAQSTDQKIKEILQSVRELVSSGSSLAEAMQEFPSVFDTFQTSMVSAGEESGALAPMLEKLAGYMKTRNKLIAKMQTVMVYPMVLAVLGFGVVSFLLTAVVPKITKSLKTQNSEMPLPTKMLLWISDVFVDWWWLLLLLLVGAVFLVKHLLAKPKIRLWWDEYLMSVPVLGGLLKAAMLSRFAVTFSTLLESGIPAVQGMELTSSLVGNTAFGKLIREAAQKVQDGKNISEAMMNPKFVPSTVTHVISIGEQSGEISDVLREMSVDFDEDLENATERFASLLEPLMIVFMATIVGFIVLAIVLPIIQMSSQL